MGELWSGGGVNNSGTPTQPGRTPGPASPPKPPQGSVLAPGAAQGTCDSHGAAAAWGPAQPRPSPPSARRSTRCCAPTSPAGARAPGAPSASCSTAPRSASAGGQLRPQPQGPATRPPGAEPLPATGPGEQDVGAVRQLQGRAGGSRPHSRSVRDPLGSPPTPPSSSRFKSKKRPQPKGEDQVVSGVPCPWEEGEGLISPHFHCPGQGWALPG